MMAKDVTALAPRSVYELESSPIEFWNRNVFRFGGQIMPITPEEAFVSGDSMSAFADDILSRSGTR